MFQTVLYQGRTIHFRDEGKGNPIVLLHGFLESIEIWNEFSYWLSNDFRVISIDLPGFGKTDRFGEVHSMELMADCVYSVLKQQQIKTCLMIGHSMGGYATLAFAEKYSNHLKGFGLFHSNAIADTKEAKLNRSRAIEVIKWNHVNFIKEFIPDLFAPENVKKFYSEIELLKERAGMVGQKSIIAAMEGMKVRTDKLNLLRITELPVLFIIGKQDIRVPLETIMQQASLPSHSETLVLKDVGHMGFIEAREKICQTIRYFGLKIFG